MSLIELLGKITNEAVISQNGNCVVTYACSWSMIRKGSDGTTEFSLLFRKVGTTCFPRPLLQNPRNYFNLLKLQKSQSRMKSYNSSHYF